MVFNLTSLSKDEVTKFMEVKRLLLSDQTANQTAPTVFSGRQVQGWLCYSARSWPNADTQKDCQQLALTGS